MNRFIAFLFMVVSWACKEKATHQVISHTASDSIINSTLKEEKIMDEDSNLHDRTIWQRPYEIINMLGSLEDKTVADIGAGSGYFSFKFIHTAKKVIAIDIEKELIDLMIEEKDYYKEEIKSKFEARLAKPNDPMLKKEEVDIVFLSNTYFWLSASAFRWTP